MTSVIPWNRQMAPEEKTLYQTVGQCIAKARKELGLTQTQVAKQLGISQQSLAHFVVGRLRVLIATLVPLTEILNSSQGKLVGCATTAKTATSSKLQQQIEQVAQRPRTKQKLASEMLDAIIQQQQAS